MTPQRGTFGLTPQRKIGTRCMWALWPTRRKYGRHVGLSGLDYAEQPGCVVIMALLDISCVKKHTHEMPGSQKGMYCDHQRLMSHSSTVLLQPCDPGVTVRFSCLAVPAAVAGGSVWTGTHRHRLLRGDQQLVRQRAGQWRVGGGPLGLDGPAAEGLWGLVVNRIRSLRTLGRLNSPSHCWMPDDGICYGWLQQCCCCLLPWCFRESVMFGLHWILLSRCWTLKLNALSDNDVFVTWLFACC